MIRFTDFVAGLRSLDLPASAPVIAHASLSAFGMVEGGAPVVVDALLQVYPTLVMPAFTYKTMLTPRIGPPDNGLTYGISSDANLAAQFFTPDLAVDQLIGIIPDTLRCYPQASRSDHPILSFTGVNALPYLRSQTLAEPLAPIGELLKAEGWVLLLGVDHTANTSLHYAEYLAGRKQFVRWALTPRGVVECPGFPGCSDGFQAIIPRLAQVARQIVIGQGLVRAIPLAGLIEAAKNWIEADPQALLCGHSYCERCYSIRKTLPGTKSAVQRNGQWPV